MGSHANGQLSFGIAFPSEYNFPWGEEDIEDWWLKVKGFKPSYELFNKEGNYVIPKPTQEQIDKEKRKFLKENPLSFELVTIYSYEYPGYVLAIPDSIWSAYGGGPAKIEPSSLGSYYEEGQALVEFIREHFKELDEVDMEPGWYLTAYYG